MTLFLKGKILDCRDIKTKNGDTPVTRFLVDDPFNPVVQVMGYKTSDPTLKEVNIPVNVYVKDNRLCISYKGGENHGS